MQTGRSLVDVRSSRRREGTREYTANTANSREGDVLRGGELCITNLNSVLRLTSSLRSPFPVVELAGEPAAVVVEGGETSLHSEAH